MSTDQRGTTFILEGVTPKLSGLHCGFVALIVLATSTVFSMASWKAVYNSYTTLKETVPDCLVCVQTFTYLPTFYP